MSGIVPSPGGSYGWAISDEEFRRLAHTGEFAPEQPPTQPPTEPPPVGQTKPVQPA